MKNEKGLLSEKLKTALQKNIEEKRQSLLFLNRRGFANFILCPECGATFKCPNCSVTLTFFFKGDFRKLADHPIEFSSPTEYPISQFC